MWKVSVFGGISWKCYQSNDVLHDVVTLLSFYAIVILDAGVLHIFLISLKLYLSNVL